MLYHYDGIHSIIPYNSSFIVNCGYKCCVYSVVPHRVDIVILPDTHSMLNNLAMYVSDD